MLGQNEIQYSLRKEITTVFPESNTFESQIHFEGRCNANTKNHIKINFGELETIEEIEAQYQSKNKWKKVSKKNVFTESLMTSSFYSGMQTATVPFPKMEEDYLFKYDYKTINEELLFLSYLDFSGLSKIDSFNYQINLPNTHELHFQMDTSLMENSLVTYTEVQIGDQRRYIFSSSSKKVENYPKGSDAFVRLIITPVDKKPYDFYNDWYNQLVKPSTQLNDELKETIKNEVKDISNDKEKIEKIFDLIKERTSYIAIENGICAVKPRDIHSS